MSKHKRKSGGGLFDIFSRKVDLKTSGLKNKIGNVTGKVKGNIVKFEELGKKGMKTKIKFNLSNTQKNALSLLKSEGNKEGYKDALLGIQKAAEAQRLAAVTSKSPIQGIITGLKGESMGTIARVKDKVGKKITQTNLFYGDNGKQLAQKTLSSIGKKGKVDVVHQYLNNNGRVRKLLEGTQGRFGSIKGKSVTNIVRNEADPNKVTKMVTKTGFLGPKRVTNIRHDVNGIAGKVGITTTEKRPLWFKKTLRRDTYNSMNYVPVTALGRQSTAFKNTITARQIAQSNQTRLAERAAALKGQPFVATPPVIPSNLQYTRKSKNSLQVTNPLYTNGVASPMYKPSTSPHYVNLNAAVPPVVPSQASSGLVKEATNNATKATKNATAALKQANNIIPVPPTYSALNPTTKLPKGQVGKDYVAVANQSTPNAQKLYSPSVANQLNNEAARKIKELEHAAQPGKNAAEKAKRELNAASKLETNALKKKIAEDTAAAEEALQKQLQNRTKTSGVSFTNPAYGNTNTLAMAAVNNAQKLKRAAENAATAARTAEEAASKKLTRAYNEAEHQRKLANSIGAKPIASVDLSKATQNVEKTEAAFNEAKKATAAAQKAAENAAEKAAQIQKSQYLEIGNNIINVPGTKSLSSDYFQF